MSFEAIYGEPLIVPCRVQYVNLVEPDTKGQFARGNYCLTMLIDKEDNATMQSILAACAEVGQVSDYRQLKKHPFLNQRREFRDGDDPNQNPQQKDRARVGQYFCTIGTDKHFDTFIMEGGDFVPCHAAEIYDGCYCAVLCTPCQYREGEVTLYLNAVTKVRDGQRIASRIDPMQAMRNWAGVPADTKQEVETSPEPAGPGPVVTMPAAQSVTPDIGTRPKRGRPPMNQTEKAEATSTPEVVGPVVTKPVIANGRSSLSDIMSK